MPSKLKFPSALYTLLLLTAVCAAHAQESATGQESAAENKPAVAVYVTGNVPDYMKTHLGKHLLAALIKVGAAASDENTAAFLAVANQEQLNRNTAALNDSVICRLAQKFGQRYVCVASIDPAPGAFRLSARVMSAKTGQSRFNGEISYPLTVLDDLAPATDILIEKMFGNKPVFGGQPAPTPEPPQTAQTPPPTAVAAPAAPISAPLAPITETSAREAVNVPPTAVNVPPAAVSDPITINNTAEPVTADNDETAGLPNPPIVPVEYAPTVAVNTDTAAPEPPKETIVVPNEQGKQTVAVYMAGQEPYGANGVHHIIGGELARVLSESDKYIAVDRTETILEQLDREHVYQRSGAVDDDQIKAIGHQLGVQYLCISNINAVGRRYYLDTRLVDIVTAEIVRSVTATSTLKDAAEMSGVGRNIALELLEADKTRRQRALRKKIFRGAAIGLDALGVLTIAYGYIENNNVIKQINNDNGPEADRAATRRNAAYIAGAAILASGIAIHVAF